MNYSDDYETVTDLETADDNSNTRHPGSENRNEFNGQDINSTRDVYFKTDIFLAIDPFVEIKDEHFHSHNDTSTDEAQVIHLDNGFSLCGKFRKKAYSKV